MQVIIQPSSLAGTVWAPASKSSMQRACAAALLHDGETVITNPGKSNDDLAAVEVIRNLGAMVSLQNDKLIIKSNGINAVDEYIDCGESGLGMRLFTPIGALSPASIIIKGNGSLLTRPMDFFDTVFPKMKVTVKTNNGKLPIQVQGPLVPSDITIDGSLSSQFLTGLLFAYGHAATEPVSITVNNLKSKPYVDLTLKVMSYFGYDVINDNYRTFIINPKKPMPYTINYMVEGDWSGAAFLLVAGAIAGGTVVKGLDVFSTQADKNILQALMMAQARLSVTEQEITVSPASLRAFHFDATDCPDLFPPLVALAAYCDGSSVIEGVTRLAHKESNRALTLQEEFAKLGITIKLQDDLMIINGGEGLTGGTVHSHHDHRIAMACAVAALKANGETIIKNAGAINKSYPDFYDDLKLLGAAVSLDNN